MKRNAVCDDEWVIEGREKYDHVDEGRLPNTCRMLVEVAEKRRDGQTDGRMEFTGPGYLVLVVASISDQYCTKGIIIFYDIALYSFHLVLIVPIQPSSSALSYLILSHFMSIISIYFTSFHLVSCYFRWYHFIYISGVGSSSPLMEVLRVALCCWAFLLPSKKSANRL